MKISKVYIYKNCKNRMFVSNKPFDLTTREIKFSNDSMVAHREVFNAENSHQHSYDKISITTFDQNGVPTFNVVCHDFEEIVGRFSMRAFEEFVMYKREVNTPKRPINSNGVCYYDGLCTVESDCANCKHLDKNGTLRNLNN